MITPLKNPFKIVRQELKKITIYIFILISYLMDQPSKIVFHNRYTLIIQEMKHTLKYLEMKAEISKELLSI